MQPEPLNSPQVRQPTRPLCMQPPVTKMCRSKKPWSGNYLLPHRAPVASEIVSHKRDKVRNKILIKDEDFQKNMHIMWSRHSQQSFCMCHKLEFPACDKSSPKYCSELNVPFVNTTENWNPAKLQHSLTLPFTLCKGRILPQEVHWHMTQPMRNQIRETFPH